MDPDAGLTAAGPARPGPSSYAEFGTTIIEEAVTEKLAVNVPTVVLVYLA